MISLPNKNERTIADWVELHVALRQESIAQAEVLSVIEGAFGDEPDETMAAGVWQELETRATYYFPCPYDVDGLAILPRLPLSGLASVSYKICLVLSLYGSHSREVQDFFEEICNQAINKYVGGNSQIFAWRDGNIAGKMRVLAEQMNEMLGRKPLPTDKDCGVDVVSWRPFPDRRSGQLILLTQCASGHNWATKRSIPIQRWNQYFHWAVNPTPAFAIPAMVSQVTWHDKNCDDGLFFDRARLINLLDGQNSAELEQGLNGWLAEWLEENDN